MFEYTCPECLTTTRATAIQTGKVTLCTGCSRQLRVVFEEDDESGAPPEAQGADAPEWWASPRLVAACAVAGTGLAVVIVLLWATFGRGPAGAEGWALFLVGGFGVAVLSGAGAVAFLWPFLDRRGARGRPAAPPRRRKDAPVPEWVEQLSEVPVPPAADRPAAKDSRPSIMVESGPSANHPPAAPESPLLRRTTCPHCWHGFPPEEVLWISAHSDLLGDPRLGPEKPQRFLPTRFNLDGNALDARGVPCLSLACPNCHLPVPRGLLETEPFFVSLLGGPGCGKSYLLAAMTWQLRQVLPREFALTFQDADPESNTILNGYEQSLFQNARQDDLVPLADLIRKTEETGDLYDNVSFGNQLVYYPRPFLFALGPAGRHPNAGARRRLSRMMCLYDNAGEQFQPGKDTTQSQATRHLAQSRLLLFLFDPTQDQRFRERGRAKGIDIPAPARQVRQDVILMEVAARVRRLTNLPQTARHPHPLFVIVTKYDTWAHLLGDKLLTDEPWRPTRKGITALDGELITDCSRRLRQLLQETCPELVAAAEGFAQHVVYFPVSALGRRPQLDPQTKRWGILPRKLTPIWAPVPLLYGLSRTLQGLIANVKVSGVVPIARGAQPSAGRKPAGASAAGGGGR